MDLYAWVVALQACHRRLGPRLGEAAWSANSLSPAIGYGRARSQKVALISAYFIETSETSAELQDCFAL